MAVDDTLTHAILGCAMEVHNVLANGFQELVCRRAPAIEFAERGIEFRREQEMPLLYKE